MSHHGWIPEISPDSITPAGLKSPFGRMFPATDTTYSSHAIALLSGAMGPLMRLKSNKAKTANPAGYTFLGQFIDHDMTEFRVIGKGFDIVPQNPTIGQRQLVLEDQRLNDQLPTTTNGRSGRLDLDSVYGLLGTAQPDLYTNAGLFRLHSNDKDILRGDEFRNGRLIADPRNDENKIIVQVHVLLERLHNKIHAAKSGSVTRKGPGGDLFNETKRQVQTIYRNIILHDYLPRIVTIEHIGKVVDALAEGRTCYQAMNRRCRRALSALGIADDEVNQSVAMPVEFSHAAFRLGHTQLRNRYTLNGAPEGDPANKQVPLFATGTDEIDLRGNEKISPVFQIDWANFFDGGTHPPQHGAPIDAALPDSIFRLPPPAIDAPPISLAERNIRRGVDFGLQSGQEAASILTQQYGYIHATTFEELFPDALQKQFKEILKVDPTLAWRTPLWYYIIREAEYRENGPQLGPVGGYIVAETLLGSMAETPGSDITWIQTEMAGLVDPNTLSTDAPGNPNDIKTMPQLISYLALP